MLKFALIFVLFLSFVCCKHTTPSKLTAIYGKDNRVDPFKHHDAQLQQLSKAIVLLTKDTSKPVKNGGFCSGAVFSKNNQRLVLTAGHCLKDQQACDQSYFVLNYENSPQLNAEDQVIFKCNELLISQGQPDFALASLGEIVFGEKNDAKQAAIELRFAKNTAGLPLAVIGHPEGGKKKIADDCQIGPSKGFTYTHRCDTFSGNSGSPVFELNSYQLTGILVSGRQDKTSVINGQDRYYQLGHEASTDIRVIQDHITQVFESKTNFSEVFYSLDKRLFTFMNRDLKIVCNETLPLDICKDAFSRVLSVLNKYYKTQSSLEELGTIYIENTSSLVENHFIDIPSNANEEEINSFISSWIKKRKNIELLLTLEVESKGITIKCDDAIEYTTCKKTTATIVNALAKLDQNTIDQLQLKSIYVENKTKLNPSEALIYIKEGSDTQEIIDLLSKRIELIKNPLESIAENVNVSKGTNITSHQFTLMHQRLIEVFKDNPQYDRFNLDVNTIYIEKFTQINNPGFIDLKYDLSIPEIEAILRQRHVPQ